jgi:hypothetical protein
MSCRCYLRAHCLLLIILFYETRKLHAAFKRRGAELANSAHFCAGVVIPEPSRRISANLVLFSLPSYPWGVGGSRGVSRNTAGPNAGRWSHTHRTLYTLQLALTNLPWKRNELSLSIPLLISEYWITMKPVWPVKVGFDKVNISLLW